MTSREGRFSAADSAVVEAGPAAGAAAAGLLRLEAAAPAEAAEDEVEADEGPAPFEATLPLVPFGGIAAFACAVKVSSVC